MSKRQPPENLVIAVLVAGRAVSSIGDLLYLVAINIFVLSLSHSPLAVSGLWIMGRMAGAITAPWAGSITDRLPLKATLATVEVLRAAGLLAMPFLRQLWLLYGDLFLLGGLAIFFNNAFLPYRTMVIPPSRHRRVNALMAMTRYSALIVGPALAGAMLLHGSIRVPLWSDAVSFLLSALSFLGLPPVHRSPDPGRSSRRPERPWPTLRRDWQEALVILRHQRLFGFFMGLNIGILVLGAVADSQEVTFATRALHLGHLGYAMMVTAAGIGYLCGSVLLNAVLHRVALRWLMGLGLWLSSMGYLMYALAPGFDTAVAGLVMLGLWGSARSMSIQTYQQAAVPSQQMGRVNNVLNLPEEGLQILLILLAGWAAGRIGVRSVMVLATVPQVLMGFWAFGVAGWGRGRRELGALDTPPTASL